MARFLEYFSSSRRLLRVMEKATATVSTLVTRAVTVNSLAWRLWNQAKGRNFMGRRFPAQPEVAPQAADELLLRACPPPAAPEMLEGDQPFLPDRWVSRSRRPRGQGRPAARRQALVQAGQQGLQGGPVVVVAQGRLQGPQVLQLRLGRGREARRPGPPGRSAGA